MVVFATDHYSATGFKHDSFVLLSLILMNKLTVVFDPYAAADHRDMVQAIVDNHNVATNRKGRMVSGPRYYYRP